MKSGIFHSEKYTDAKAKLYNAIIMGYKFHFDTSMTIAIKKSFSRQISFFTMVFSILNSYIKYRHQSTSTKMCVENRGFNYCVNKQNDNL